MAQVRVSDSHKATLDDLVKLEKSKGLSPMPTQESVLNALIEKEAKRKGVKK